MSEPTPIHTHVCERCRFLGSVNSAGVWGDLYVCERGPTSRRSAIFRWDSDGPAFSSIPVLLAPQYPDTHPLRIAAALYTRL